MVVTAEELSAPLLAGAEKTALVCGLNQALGGIDSFLATIERGRDRYEAAAGQGVDHGSNR